MEAKAFAVGLRVEHPQELINLSQYGQAHPDFLPPAAYKLTAQTAENRGVYCPGGYVVNASSEPGRLAVNGMSYSKRDGRNANSAIIVSVTPADYGANGPLSGVTFQRRLEEKAFHLANGAIPMQRYGEFAADEIIDGMLEKGIKDIDAIAVSAGMADQGVGKLIKDHRVKSLITTHIGLNPIAKDQMFAGELAIEFSPQGTFAERIRCGGAGLGGCLTPTGLGTEVEEGKQKLTIDGKEYLLELPLRADVALIKATKADTAGNISFRMNSRATNSTMAMAADTVIVEVEEIVEVGELGPEEIDVPAPVIDMIYERTGEKRPMCPMWQRAKAKAKGGQ